jgi:transposase
LDFFARFQVNGRRQSQRHGDEQTHGATSASDGLNFDWVLDLHWGRLLYKVAVVKRKYPMSLPKVRLQRTFLDTDQVLSRLLKAAPEGAQRFVFFADRIWPELLQQRPKLEKMYCVENGRPAEEPVLLLAVTILQFMERLPDRQAAEACTWDGRWKLALHMQVDEPAFHATTLVKFRERLVEHGLERLGFDGVLEAMREAGYLPKKSRQRLDSSHVIGLVAHLSRLECVRETLRLALEALEPIEALARAEAWPLWWERYVESKLDYQAGAEQLRAKMQQVGADARDLLRWAKGQEDAAAAQEALALLERVYAENFEETSGETVDQRRAQPPGAVHNPHDPQAQWSTKNTIKNKSWVGYKAQVAETVEEQPRAAKEPTLSVITAVVTQEAIASDKAAVPVVEQAWDATGQDKPSRLYVDAGYTSGAEVVRVEAEGRELQGPMAPPPSREGRISSEAFDVSVAGRRAVCPAGHASTNCSRLDEQKTGKTTYRFEWSHRLCEACEKRAECLGKGPSHRTLLVGEHHDRLQARRLEQKTQAFKVDMKHRNGIEGTISELVRGHGLRRCRYRGLAKTRLQNWFIGAACNLKRWCRRQAWERKRATDVMGADMPVSVAA